MMFIAFYPNEITNQSEFEQYLVLANHLNYGCEMYPIDLI